MRSLLLLAALCVSAAAAAPPADPAKAKIDKAKAAYNDELQKLETTVANMFDTAEAAARKQGDKAALDRFKVARVSFDLTGTLPNGVPASASQKFTAASNALTAAYAQAVKDYTKAGKDSEAEAAQKELDQLKKDGAGARYFMLVNKKTGLAVAAENEDGGRGSHLVQVKQSGKLNQQWSFVPTGDPTIYQIKNRAGGHFFNIPGPAKDGAQIHLWDGGGGTNNNLIPARSGFYYSFLFVDSKKFVAVADTKDAEGKPVIHSEKPADDAHLWGLVLVK